MRRIICLLLCFSFFSSVTVAPHVAPQSYTKHRITSGTGYGQANNIPMAFLMQVPVSTEKVPLIIYLHGCDDCGPTPSGTSSSDPNYYGSIDILNNKGLPDLIAGTGEELPQKLKPGGSSYYDNRKFAVMAPQCSTTYASCSGGGTFPFAYVAEMIKYAQNNLAAVIDLDNISVVSYSLGAGLALSMTRDPFINANLSCVIAIAPGYNTNTSTNYPFIADSGLPIYIFTTVLDAKAPYTIARSFVNNVNAQNPVYPPTLIEFSGATAGTTNHDDILPTVISTTADNASFVLSNGGSWPRAETIYETILRHKKIRRKR